MGTARPGHVSGKRSLAPHSAAPAVERPHKTAQLIQQLLMAEPRSATPLGMQRGGERLSMRGIICQFIVDNPGCTQLAIVRHVRHPGSPAKDTYVATQLLTLLHQKRIRRQEVEGGARYFPTT